MTEPVIILEPGDERAQHIARALSSRTAGKILDILSDGPRPLSFIAEQLSIPLTQVKYHVDNLLDVGILEVTEEKYSVKGRRVKIYGLKHQVLVVAPKMVNLKAMLLKYSSVFGLFLLVTLALTAIRDHFLILQQPPLLGGGSLDLVPEQPLVSSIMENVGSESTIVLLFCAGGCVAIAAALIAELFLKRKGLE
ncbi:MAG: helix-turn-helix domain-containing protein [Methanolinea sp.]|jgi:DNA-binding transcriptional ArsR family regulator|nr:helix-turn-helix domain-containing protein [Methanolinea sp.]